MSSRREMKSVCERLWKTRLRKERRKRALYLMPSRDQLSELLGECSPLPLKQPNQCLGMCVCEPVCMCMLFRWRKVTENGICLNMRSSNMYVRKFLRFDILKYHWKVSLWCCWIYTCLSNWDSAYCFECWISHFALLFNMLQKHFLVQSPFLASHQQSFNWRCSS